MRTHLLTDLLLPRSITGLLIWHRAHLRVEQFHGISENAVKTRRWIAGVGLRAGRHRQEATRAGDVALRIPIGLFGHSIRENVDLVCDLADTRPIRQCRLQQPDRNS